MYHIEGRPRDAGRCVIVDTIKVEDVYGPGWNAKTRVQEYGGGAAIAYGGTIYFSNFGDFRVYKLDVGSGDDPVAVTPGNPFTSSSAIRSFDDEPTGVGGD